MDHSSRGVLPTVARCFVWSTNLVDKGRGGQSPRWAAEPEKQTTMFQALLAHLQEALQKRHLIYIFDIYCSLTLVTYIVYLKSN
jgi:hypothetical protein